MEARNRVGIGLSYRPARLYGLAESINSWAPYKFKNTVTCCYNREHRGLRQEQRPWLHGIWHLDHLILEKSQIIFFNAWKRTAKYKHCCPGKDFSPFCTWLSIFPHLCWTFRTIYALIKKKIKFSSYVRKFRMKQLQSHIWLTPPHIWGNICAFPHILGSPSSYMTLQLGWARFA